MSSETAEAIRTVHFDTSVTSLEFNPINSRLLLAVLGSGEAVWIDLRQRLNITRRKRKGAVYTRPAHPPADEELNDATKELHVRSSQTSTARRGLSESPSKSSNNKTASPRGRTASEPPSTIWSEAQIQPLPVKRWYFGGEQEDQLAPYLAANEASAVNDSIETPPPATTDKDAPQPVMIEAALWAKDGRHVFAGTSSGSLVIYDTWSRLRVQSEGLVQPKSAKPKDMPKAKEGSKFSEKSRVKEMKLGDSGS